MNYLITEIIEIVKHSLSAALMDISRDQYGLKFIYISS